MTLVDPCTKCGEDEAVVDGLCDKCIEAKLDDLETSNG